MEGGRLHSVSDPLTLTAVPTWFDFDQSFQIPTPASTGPLDSSSYEIDFFNPTPLLPCTASYIPGDFIPILHVDGMLTLDHKAPTIHTDHFSALFDIPQPDQLQPGLPTFDSDWTEFLNFEPDLSLSPYSLSPPSSLANTPPLTDDIILFPSSSSDGDLSSPDPLLNILPRMDEKHLQSTTIGGPLIHEQDFILPLGEEAGISAAALLSSY